MRSYKSNLDVNTFVAVAFYCIYMCMDFAHSCVWQLFNCSQSRMKWDDHLSYTFRCWLRKMPLFIYFASPAVAVDFGSVGEHIFYWDFFQISKNATFTYFKWRVKKSSLLSIDGTDRQTEGRTSNDRYMDPSLWRCLSYRGSAGGYLFIECRGVAALQMRSSQ